jgi:IS5 family transposase
MGLLTLGKGLKAKGGDKSSTRASVSAELLSITEEVLRRARAVRAHLVRGLEAAGVGWPGDARRRLVQLDVWLERTARIIEQTKQVLGGNPYVKNRLVSLFDPDARPIRKGQLKFAGGTQFGYKVVVADDETGFVTDVHVVDGNPADSTLLVAAVKRHRERVCTVPRAVAVDRGMTSAANDAALAELGVAYRSLPKQGSLTPVERVKERKRWFRQLQRFRAGGEARISVLKRKYGWRRSRLRGLVGVQTWVGWGAIAHNLTKYARLQVALA